MTAKTDTTRSSSTVTHLPAGHSDDILHDQEVLAEVAREELPRLRTQTSIKVPIITWQPMPWRSRRMTAGVRRVAQSTKCCSPIVKIQTKKQPQQDEAVTTHFKMM